MRQANSFQLETIYLFSRTSTKPTTNSSSRMKNLPLSSRLKPSTENLVPHSQRMIVGQSKNFSFSRTASSFSRGNSALRRNLSISKRQAATSRAMASKQQRPLEHFWDIQALKYPAISSLIFVTWGFTSSGEDSKTPTSPDCLLGIQPLVNVY